MFGLKANGNVAIFDFERKNLCEERDMAFENKKNLKNSN